MTSVIAQLMTDTLTARCDSVTISRNVLGSKSGSKVLSMLLLVRSLHLQLCQLLAKFIPRFFVLCGSWLTNRRTITMRSSAWRSRLSFEVGAARSALTARLLCHCHTPTPLCAEYSSARASSSLPVNVLCCVPHAWRCKSCGISLCNPSPRAPSSRCHRG